MVEDLFQKIIVSDEDGIHAQNVHGHDASSVIKEIYDQFYIQKYTFTLSQIYIIWNYSIHLFTICMVLYPNILFLRGGEG